MTLALVMSTSTTGLVVSRELTEKVTAFPGTSFSVALPIPRFSAGRHLGRPDDAVADVDDLACACR